MAKFYKYFRISKVAASRLPSDRIDGEYSRLRTRTFWAATLAYSLYYVCRMTLNVVKQPLIDGGVFSATELGLVGSSMLLVYAVGKFVNGFIADYCNVRRFMAIGLLVSAVANFLLGALGAAGGIVPTSILLVGFVLMWGFNGWAQSMGAPAGIVSLSRWFPLSRRGTFYSIFSATPYLGKFLSFIVTGLIVEATLWQYGFVFAGLAGLAGAGIALLVCDTPESRGLPSIQEYSGEEIRKADALPTRELQKLVFKHPGIWVIALSSAFVYIAQYAVSGWGVLFLQKAKDFSLARATQAIAFSEVFGILGTILAGWLSDRIFKGNRVKPVAISGLAALGALCGMLFLRGGFAMNVFFISVFSLSIGVLYCIVAGLMALDIVPRRATGAALGIVGISSYVAAGIQDLVSGLLIQSSDGAYDFLPVSVFWAGSCLLAFLLPVLGWNKLLSRKYFS